MLPVFSASACLACLAFVCFVTLQFYFWVPTRPARQRDRQGVEAVAELNRLFNRPRSFGDFGVSRLKPFEETVSF